jgi:transposase
MSWVCGVEPWEDGEKYCRHFSKSDARTQVALRARRYVRPFPSVSNGAMTPRQLLGRRQSDKLAHQMWDRRPGSGKKFTHRAAGADPKHQARAVLISDGLEESRGQGQAQRQRLHTAQFSVADELAIGSQGGAAEVADECGDALVGLDARAASVMEVEAVGLAVTPLDLRAGNEAAPACVVTVFGTARPHRTYLSAKRRANRMKVLVHDGIGVWLSAHRLYMGFVWPRDEDLPSIRPQLVASRTGVRERDVPDALAVDPARIRQAGLMDAATQAGPFALDIRRAGFG